MDLEKIKESLSPIERKVLPFLKDGLEIEEILKKSNLTETEIMRALQWLENKGVVKLKSFVKEMITIGDNGKVYVKNGLPEKRFLEVLKERMNISEIKKLAKLDENEIRFSLGFLKERYAISISGDKIEPTSEKDRLLNEILKIETLLKKLPIYLEDITKDEKAIIEMLLKRKDVIRKERKKFVNVELTEIGKKILNEKLEEGLLENVTPNMLKEGSWKGKKFRRYDIKTSVPRIYGGKRHFYSIFLQEVREKLLALGFKEMYGPIIELEFFNFDALFQPQNHPARDWSATYSIKDPKYGRLPDKKLVLAVKRAHEKGVGGSKGWGYKWDGIKASRLIARAHDTAISPRFLSKGVEIPGKYFSLVRCFRPDVIDATHGVEFNQLGGFVIDYELSFRHLLGILKKFVIEITGFEEIKFMPDYFPFTEPSVQVSLKHPQLGWVEIAGAGVFRPELTIPLSVKEPVIAWGFGLDRLAMMKLEIKDIRDLFSRDLSFLRERKGVW